MIEISTKLNLIPNVVIRLTMWKMFDNDNFQLSDSNHSDDDFDIVGKDNNENDDNEDERDDKDESEEEDEEDDDEDDNVTNNSKLDQAQNLFENILIHPKKFLTNLINLYFEDQNCDQNFIDICKKNMDDYLTEMIQRIKISDAVMTCSFLLRVLCDDALNIIKTILNFDEDNIEYISAPKYCIKITGTEAYCIHEINSMLDIIKTQCENHEKSAFIQFKQFEKSIRSNKVITYKFLYLAKK